RHFADVHRCIIYLPICPLLSYKGQMIILTTTSLRKLMAFLWTSAESGLKDRDDIIKQLT
ncbi:MAG: hypothetical protein ABFC34_10285, partial [Methanobacterium sp.]